MIRSLRTIACLKLLRGTIAITIGIGLIYLSLSSQDNSWLNSFMLNLAENDPFFQIVLHFFSRLTEKQLLSIALLALSLGALRYVEAAGIWRNKNWAHQLAVLTGLVYIPFEIIELNNGFSLVIAIILIINILIVMYLLHVLYLNKKNDITGL